jgi:YHS domain-containing protein
MKRVLQVAAIVVLALTSAFAGNKNLVNTDKSGVALQGYDPVAYFTDNQPVRGLPQYQSQYNGATYYFASAEHKVAFDKDPAHYAPQFGGYCAWAVSQGHTAKISVDAFQVVDNRLLLQYDKSIRDKFNKDTRGNLTKADQNWPSLVEKSGK